MASRRLVAQGNARRRAMLAFIRDYIDEHGWPPTFADIAKGVGLASPNSTRAHLQRLAEDGYLVLGAHQSRSIALVDPAPDGWTRAGEFPPPPQGAAPARTSQRRVNSRAMQVCFSSLSD